MKRLCKVILVAIVVLAVAGRCGYGQTLEDLQQNVSPALFDGVVSYIYGYPLMMFGVTGRTGTTVPDAMTKLGGAPLNQFGKETVLPNATFTAVVLPSTSTLYASSFLNLCEEPVILHLPNFGGRFFIMQMLDGWTEVSGDSPGTDKGSPEGNYALVGPACNGHEQPAITIPVVKTIRIPTSSMWIIGRIYTTGSDWDIKDIVKNLYPGLTLTPLSKYVAGETFTPPDTLSVQPLADTVTPPLRQVAGMDACAFYQNLAAMMNFNLPIPGQDDPVTASLLRLGLVVKNDDPTKGSVPLTGTNFDCTTLHKARLENLQDAVAAANNILDNVPATKPTATGWTVSLDVGVYGRRYLLRAEVAQQALGANRKEDAVYGYTQTDGRGIKLRGDVNYAIHFLPVGQDAGGIPPVHQGGFWSLTIYDADGKLVPSPDPAANWNAVGMPMVQNHSACFNGDGSLDLYLQATAPPAGSKQFCNWLPTPAKGGYIAFLRMYWPADAILNKDWVPPGIVRN
ncbi:DUF1254 domain-containing protein [Tunturibacter empetritectus]|uniref:DUF1254 domain-containing protein n=1 Tax=Tunturiibacter empetritectus TaxID=3069691 RepID=A0A7W8IHX6_9BACT|nr:DUF1254 domain-containing protein [Edaphobacter lichenicola]MBB5317463.1 hypothetical protein [Edaphobacter lichenicola]